MILTNCKKLLTNPNGNDYNLTIYLTDFNGKSQSGNLGYNIFTSGNALRVLVGSGTDEVKETDYKLSNMLDTSVLNVLSLSSKVGGKINNWTRLATVVTTFNNVTSEDVTVTELGIAHQVGVTSGGVTTYTRYLLTRELLATPVTIKAGESYTFTAVIDIK